MTITNKNLIKKIVSSANNSLDEIQYSELLYKLWVKFNVTDEQAELLQRAKNCGPDRVANTLGDCL